MANSDTNYWCVGDCLLWGGNYQKSPNKVASNSVESRVVESANTASNQNVDVEPTTSSDAKTTEIAPTATPDETAKPVETVKPTEEVTPTETAATEVEKPTATPKSDTQAQPTATPKAAKTSVPETKATANQ